MPRRLPPYVERNHVKGHTYLSFRRGKGAQVRLPKDPTSPEFMVAYQAALLGQSAPLRPQLPSLAPGSLAALIDSYICGAPNISAFVTRVRGVQQTS
jgi:hypothetical protein